MNIGNTHYDFEHHGYIMGILNATPDSFSDGGLHNTIQAAVNRTLEMIKQGASIIDIGGESTRPGHDPVDYHEEIARIVPIIEAIRQESTIPISVDTSKSQVAQAALKAGASMINDVWGLKKDPELAKVIAEYQVPCCIMHNRDKTQYDALIKDVINDLQESIDIALDAGIKKSQLIVDPGIGFAKTLNDNLYMMNHLDELQVFDLPILLGTSRKSMIGLALSQPVDQRVEGTIATTTFGYVQGCRIFRVHDVHENYLALKMIEAIKNGG